MDREFNGKKIKYEEGKLWLWREMSSRGMLHNPYWFELKGWVDKSNGYRRVSINDKSYLYHRVVYFIHNQEWNIRDNCRDNIIDHIDRNPLNNNIENLRVVTNQENLWNRDCKGYCFDKAKGKYHAQICVNYKKKYLGYFENEDDARTAYLNAKAIHHNISSS